MPHLNHPLRPFPLILSHWLHGRRDQPTPHHGLLLGSCREWWDIPLPPLLQANIPYLYRDIWVYGYMDIWIYGYMDIWICTRTLYFSHIHAGIGTKCLLLLADKWVFSTSCACLLTCIKLFLLFQQILRKMQEIDVMVPNVLNWSIIIQTSLGCKHYRDKTTEHTQIHPHNLCDFEALLLLLNQNLTGF